jgi:hypothetical protein
MTASMTEFYVGSTEEGETGGVRLPSDGNRWIGIGVMRGAIAKRLLAAGYAVSHAPPLRRRVWLPST